MSIPASSTHKGFTLVELLVVISVIAVLSVIGITIFSGVQKNARDAKRRGDLKALSLAFEQYKSKNGSYPTGTYFSAWNKDCWSSPCDSFYAKMVTGGFIQSLPSDPVNREGGAGNYLGDNAPTDLAYVYESDGTNYTLGTNLENQTGTANRLGNYQVHNQL